MIQASKMAFSSLFSSSVAQNPFDLLGEHGRHQPVCCSSLMALFYLCWGSPCSPHMHTRFLLLVYKAVDDLAGLQKFRMLRFPLARRLISQLISASSRNHPLERTHLGLSLKHL